MIIKSVLGSEMIMIIQVVGIYYVLLLISTGWAIVRVLLLLFALWTYWFWKKTIGGVVLKLIHKMRRYISVIVLKWQVFKFSTKFSMLVDPVSQHIKLIGSTVGLPYGAIWHFPLIVIIFLFMDRFWQMRAQNVNEDEF